MHKSVTATSAQVAHPSAKLRRDELSEKGLCINGETHGLATHGRLCAWCRTVHRKGVLAMLSVPNAPTRPPGHKYKPKDQTRQTE